MILYVNGDSHSAGAETFGGYCFANDDPKLWKLGREPHPECLKRSYGTKLAKLLDADLICDAESASSNHRIIRTTWDRFSVIEPDIAIFGWSTWERKEFYDKDTKITWQVNAGGVGHDWPQWLKDIYPKYISEINWDDCIRASHDKIFMFHKELERREIKHIFFNTFNHFEIDPKKQYDWDNCYIDPYTASGTYYSWCIKNGFKPVNPNSYHFGEDAHSAWADFLYQKIIHNLLTST